MARIHSYRAAVVREAFGVEYTQIDLPQHVLDDVGLDHRVGVESLTVLR